MVFKKNTSPCPTVLLSLSRIHFIRVLESLSMSAEQNSFRGSFSFSMIEETGAFSILGASENEKANVMKQDIMLVCKCWLTSGPFVLYALRRSDGIIYTI